MKTTVVVESNRIAHIRHAVEQPYFVMARKAAQNKDLSWEARGVLAYLMSKPRDWEVRPKDLQHEKCGRSKVYGILKELESFGYLTKRRLNDEHGYITWEYLVNDYPQPCVENPYTDLPYTENQHITYKREEQNRDNTIVEPPSEFEKRDSEKETPPLKEGIEEPPPSSAPPPPDKPEKKPKTKVPQPSDSLTTAFAVNFFGADPEQQATINAVWGETVTWVLGSKSQPDISYVSLFEKNFGNKDQLAAADFAELAALVPVFKEWLTTQKKVTNLRSLSKFIGYWSEWRSATRPKKKLTYDPKCPKCHGSGIYENDQGAWRCNCGRMQ